MSNQYNSNLQFSRSKHLSRKMIAKVIKEDKTSKLKVIHHLGGEFRDDPLERLFIKNVNQSVRHSDESRYDMGERKFLFARYEEKSLSRMNSYPCGYSIYTEVHTDREQYDWYREQKKDHFYKSNGYGLFFNGDFNYFNYQAFLFTDWLKKDNNIKSAHYLWLDYCGFPTAELRRNTRYHINNKSFKRTFVTFYLNQRRADKSEIDLTLEKDIDKRARIVLDSILTNTNSGISGEVLLTYLNGKSPMAVLHFFKKKGESQTKNIKTMNRNTKQGKGELTQKRTTEDYVKLANRFTNKQIAIFWRMPLTRIAGFHASAKRKGLIK